MAISLLTHRELIENLVTRDIKARYKQSTLGIAWAIVTPLTTALIYTVVSKYFLKVDTGLVAFPVFAYYGLLFWTLFSGGLSGATDSLVGHLSLITKVYFPREVIPFAAVLGKLTDFFFGLLGLVPLLLIFPTSVSPAILLIAPLVLFQVLFTAGLGMLLACANLFYRDVRHLVQLLLALWLYMVPNLYPIHMVPERFLPLYLLNPMATFIHTARTLAFPQLGDEIYGLYLAIAVVVSVVTFVVGYVVFKRYEPKFAESI